MNGATAQMENPPNEPGEKKELLTVHQLGVDHPLGRGRYLTAAADICFAIDHGETLGLVGESGCGKTSVARAIIQLPAPSRGSVWLEGKNLCRLSGSRLRRLRPAIQMIFQDADAALNPGRKVGRTISMPLAIANHMHGKEQKVRAMEMMAAVGIDPGQYHRRPFQFSGGQCQRIQIARALIVRPKVLICDEPAASLDVSIQAQIITLLSRMKEEFGLTMLFISHDLAVVKHVSDRIAVMYLGRLCEIAPSQQLYEKPLHPYTRALFAAIPRPDPDAPPPRVHLKSGDIPSPLSPPSGCRFHTRCPESRPICTRETPELSPVAPGRQVACHFPLQATGC
jgi:peptide/nickel transport system ATP-binding protein